MTCGEYLINVLFASVESFHSIFFLNIFYNSKLILLLLCTFTLSQKPYDVRRKSK